MGRNDFKISCLTWNVHSLNNKCDEVMEHIVDNNADIVFLTETWQKSSHNTVTATIKRYGYTLYHKIREHDEKFRGGGIGILCSNQYQVKAKHLKIPKPQSFEFSVYSLAVQEKSDKKCTVLLIALYRDQYVPMNIFIDEFDQLVQSLVMLNTYFIISGDFNIWWGTSSDDAIRFSDLLDSYGLTQHVRQPTNAFNNILDLVITSDNSQNNKAVYNPFISDVGVSNVSLSDHYLVRFQINLIKCATKKTKKMYHRHYKSMDLLAFREDLSMLLVQQLSDNKQALFGIRSVIFNNSLSNLLDLHAPLKEKMVKAVPAGSWFNNEYALLRRQRRKAEKVAAKSGLPVHKEIFVKLRKETTMLAKSLKKAEINRSLLAANGNQKALFLAFNKLVDGKQDAQLPAHESEKELADCFGQYFVDKVKRIRESFGTGESCTQLVPDSFSGNILSDFELVTINDIESLISEYGIKCSIADAFPPDLIKDNLDLFLPIWTDLVNASLKEGSMEGLKTAIVNPLIKESTLDPEILKNYRPVSNLTFLSKIIERVVHNQLNKHMENNNLIINDQSGYKKGHSTETLLVKITNDLLIASDKNTATVLLLLDLSSAFDTVHINKLLGILFSEIGIRGTALSWFQSYLCGRSQKVKIGNAFSDEVILEFGVPQGSVLGPVLFNIYIRSFYQFVRLNSNFVVQGYADDHQLYSSFSMNNQTFMLGDNILNTLTMVKQWMNTFYLKLNKDKTNVIVFYPPQMEGNIHKINGVFLGSKCIRFPNNVKNLGVLLDSKLSFKVQVNQCVQSCFMTLRKISSVKCFLGQDHRRVLVTSLVLSQLDYCNGILYNISSDTLKRMQAVQNCAAKLIFNRRKYDNGLSSLFSTLHWLRIKERIAFKILLLVHKCLYCKSPAYLNNLLSLTDNFVRTGNLIIVKTSYACSNGAFSVCAPYLWNKLPIDIKFETRTVQFKRKLKSHLFDGL